LPPGFSVDGVCQEIRKNGIVVLEDALSPELLSSMVDEFHQALKIKALRIEDRPNRAHAKGTDLRRFGLSNLEAFFFSQDLRGISRAYWRGGIRHCHEIYVARHVVGGKGMAQDLHIDVIHQLKFFVCLNDMSAKNGAFEFVPQSHRWSQRLRAERWREITFENREITRDLPVDVGAPTPVEVRAGSLVVFDTDLFHRAGTVHEGERWVVRGHTWPSFTPLKVLATRALYRIMGGPRAGAQ
jgi:ectoine hydroxylase-related dioxygenase (phytanoyl-CoA dioxygenase family)